MKNLGTFDYTMEHEAFIGFTMLRWYRELTPASKIQAQMDARFPVEQHNALWIKLLERLNNRVT
jgi:hypothetical protein